MGAGDGCIMNVHHLFDMGGYGLFVWPAYCITLLVFGINLVLCSHEKKTFKKIIQSEINKSS